MRRNFVILLTFVMLLAAFVLPAYAVGPPPHDHFLVNPATGERTQVGPHRCDLGVTVHDAFLNFHNNVHRGAPTQKAGLVLQAELC